jgi:hypothetical protein
MLALAEAKREEELAAQEAAAAARTLESAVAAEPAQDLVIVDVDADAAADKYLCLSLKEGVLGSSFPLLSSCCCRVAAFRSCSAA